MDGLSPRSHPPDLEARMKHAADPEKFVESELDLDDGIRKLHALATAPALYPELVRLSAPALRSHRRSEVERHPHGCGGSPGVRCMHRSGLPGGRSVCWRWTSVQVHPMPLARSKPVASAFYPHAEHLHGRCDWAR
jgi:hypothetical protein